MAVIRERRFSGSETGRRAELQPGTGIKFNSRVIDKTTTFVPNGRARVQIGNEVNIRGGEVLGEDAITQAQLRYELPARRTLFVFPRRARVDIYEYVPDQKTQV